MATTATLDLLVHYICATCDNPAQLGATRLNSILWHADVIRYADTGRSITGATYVRRQFGPAPKGIAAVRARLQAEGKVVERPSQFGPFGQAHLLALTPPDTGAFTAAEISLVDMVARQVCASPSVLDDARDHVWKAAAIGEEIPMAAAAFGSNVGEIDEDDAAWARTEIARMQGAPADAA